MFQHVGYPGFYILPFVLFCFFLLFLMLFPQLNELEGISTYLGRRVLDVSTCRMDTQGFIILPFVFLSLFSPPLT